MNRNIPKVIVTRQLLPAIESRMTELFDTGLNPDDHKFSEDELAEAVQRCEVLVPTVTDSISRRLIANSGENLKLIASFGAGVDHIDLSAAREKGIIVTNTPGVLTEDTADMTMALILSVPRRFVEGQTLITQGRWKGWGPNVMLGHRIGGKTLAIIGMGRIGQAVAHRAKAFGLKVIYHNRQRLPSSLEQMLGATYEADLDTLVSQADILSIHCPATPDTHHLLDARRISLCKPECMIINVARGEIIHEEALIEALSEGRLGGAGLDVFAHEPQVDQRLLNMPNVVLIPHMGSATFEARQAAGEKVIANIRVWSDGHRPPDQVLEGWV